jgi:hypothetical protein
MGRRESIPEKVRLAQANGNEDALRRFGRAGGIEAANRRAVENAERAEDLEKFLAAQALLYHVDENGDVLPPLEDTTVH